MLQSSEKGWSAVEHDILYARLVQTVIRAYPIFTGRCMEHSLHIACKHFVETIAPASPAMIRKKIKAALQIASVNGELDLDELDNELATLDLENSEDSGDNADVEFSHGDALGKALALVKQVITPQIPRL